MIIVAVLLVLVLGAGGYMMLAKSKSSTPKNSMESAKQDKNAFTSIQDAIAHSMTITCDYSTPEGTNVKAYIKGGKVRSDVISKDSNQSGSAIIMDKKVYFWNSQGGYVMEMPDISVTPASGQDAVENKGNSTMEALEQYRQYCKPGTVSDSLFVLPTGVKFQDMSTMMVPSSKVMPSGTKPIPSGMSPEQIQQMMKQYGQPSQ